MSSPLLPVLWARNWPACHEALKRRGLLTICFNPAMNSEGAPSVRRGRQQSYSDSATQDYLTMIVRFGMALRQTFALFN